MHCGSADLAATLLRELAKLREELPWQSVRALVQPWITLFQDAGQLAKDRATLSAAAFAEAHQWTASTPCCWAAPTAARGRNASGCGTGRV